MPGFFPTIQSQEGKLQKGDYCIRYANAKNIIFSVELKNLKGEVKKLGLAIAPSQKSSYVLFVNQNEKAANLPDLITQMNNGSLKGLKPVAYKDTFLDVGEENLYRKLQQDKGKDAMQYFLAHVSMGVDTVEEYLAEQQ